jgi:uncharacterized DUF497 family protein
MAESAVQAAAQTNQLQRRDGVLRALGIQMGSAGPAGPHAVDVCTEGAYTEIVGFEWDKESKAGLNFRKHGVRMPEAIAVFDDPYAITIADEDSDPGEQRFVALGMGAAGRLLVVAFTWRSRRIP